MTWKNTKEDFTSPHWRLVKMSKIDPKKYEDMVRNPIPEVITTILQEKYKKQKNMAKSKLEEQLEKQALLERIRQMVQKW